MLTANLTRVSVRQNEDVRRISAWAAIIAVPIMIAGIYGMNFAGAFSTVFGYPLVLFVIAASVIVYKYREDRLVVGSPTGALATSHQHWSCTL